MLPHFISSTEVPESIAEVMHMEREELFRRAWPLVAFLEANNESSEDVFSLDNETPLSVYSPESTGRLTYLSNNSVVITATEYTMSKPSVESDGVSICTLPRPSVPMKSKEANPLKFLENAVEDVKQQIENKKTNCKMNVFTARQALIKQIVQRMREEIARINNNAINEAMEKGDEEAQDNTNDNDLSNKTSCVAANVSLIDNNTNKENNVQEVEEEQKNQFSSSNNISITVNSNKTNISSHELNNEDKQKIKNENEHVPIAKSKTKLETEGVKSLTKQSQGKFRTDVDNSTAKDSNNNSDIIITQKHKKDMLKSTSARFAKHMVSVPVKSNRTQLIMHKEKNASERKARQNTRPSSATLPRHKLLTPTLSSITTATASTCSSVKSTPSLEAQIEPVINVQDIVNISLSLSASASMSENANSATSSPTSETSVISTHSFPDTNKTHPFTRFTEESDLPLSWLLEQMNAIVHHINDNHRDAKQHVKTLLQMIVMLGIHGELSQRACDAFVCVMYYLIRITEAFINKVNESENDNQKDNNEPVNKRASTENASGVEEASQRTSNINDDDNTHLLSQINNKYNNLFDETLQSVTDLRDTMETGVISFHCKRCIATEVMLPVLYSLPLLHFYNYNTYKNDDDDEDNNVKELIKFATLVSKITLPHTLHKQLENLEKLCKNDNNLPMQSSSLSSSLASTVTHYTTRTLITLKPIGQTCSKEKYNVTEQKNESVEQRSTTVEEDTNTVISEFVPLTSAAAISSNVHRTSSFESSTDVHSSRPLQPPQQSHSDRMESHNHHNDSENVISNTANKTENNMSSEQKEQSNKTTISVFDASDVDSITITVQQAAECTSLQLLVLPTHTNTHEFTDCVASVHDLHDGLTFTHDGPCKLLLVHRRSKSTSAYARWARNAKPYKEWEEQEQHQEEEKEELKEQEKKENEAQEEEEMQPHLVIEVIANRSCVLDFVMSTDKKSKSKCGQDSPCSDDACYSDVNYIAEMLYALTRLKQSFAEQIIRVLNSKYKVNVEGIINSGASKGSKEVRPPSSAMKLLANGLRSDHAIHSPPKEEQITKINTSAINLYSTYTEMPFQVIQIIKEYMIEYIKSWTRHDEMRRHVSCRASDFAGVQSALMLLAHYFPWKTIWEHVKSFLCAAKSKEISVTATRSTRKANNAHHEEYLELMMYKYVRSDEVWRKTGWADGVRRVVLLSSEFCTSALNSHKTEVYELITFVLTHIDANMSLSVNTIVDGVVALLTYGTKSSVETLHTFLRDQRTRAELSVLLMQLSHSSLLHIKHFQTFSSFSSSLTPVKAQIESIDPTSNTTDVATRTSVSLLSSEVVQRSVSSLIARVLTICATHIHSFLNLPGHYFTSCKGCGLTLERQLRQSVQRVLVELFTHFNQAMCNECALHAQIKTNNYIINNNKNKNYNNDDCTKFKSLFITPWEKSIFALMTSALLLSHLDVADMSVLLDSNGLLGEWLEKTFLCLINTLVHQYYSSSCITLPSASHSFMQNSTLTIWQNEEFTTNNNNNASVTNSVESTNNTDTNLSASITTNGNGISVIPVAMYGVHHESTNVYTSTSLAFVYTLEPVLDPHALCPLLQHNPICFTIDVELLLEPSSDKFVIGLSTPALNLQSPRVDKNEDVHGVYYYASTGMLTYGSNDNNNDKGNNTSSMNEPIQAQLIPLHAHDVLGFMIEQITCANGAFVWVVHITVQHTRIASIALPSERLHFVIGNGDGTSHGVSFRCAFDHSLWHDEVANSNNANIDKSKDAKNSTLSQKRITSARPTHASHSNATSSTPVYRYSVPVTIEQQQQQEFHRKINNSNIVLYNEYKRDEYDECNTRKSLTFCRLAQFTLLLVHYFALCRSRKQLTLEQKSSSYSSTWVNSKPASCNSNGNTNNPITGTLRNTNVSSTNSNALSTFVTKWSNDLLNAAQKILHIIKDIKTQIKKQEECITSSTNINALLAANALSLQMCNDMLLDIVNVLAVAMRSETQIALFILVFTNLLDEELVREEIKCVVLHALLQDVRFRHGWSCNGQIRYAGIPASIIWNACQPLSCTTSTRLSLTLPSLLLLSESCHEATESTIKAKSTNTTNAFSSTEGKTITGTVKANEVHPTQRYGKDYENINPYTYVEYRPRFSEGCSVPAESMVVAGGRQVMFASATTLPSISSSTSSSSNANSNTTTSVISTITSQGYVIRRGTLSSKYFAVNGIKLDGSHGTRIDVHVRVQRGFTNKLIGRDCHVGLVACKVKLPPPVINMNSNEITNMATAATATTAAFNDELSNNESQRNDKDVETIKEMMIRERYESTLANKCTIEEGQIEFVKDEVLLRAYPDDKLKRFNTFHLSCYHSQISQPHASSILLKHQANWMPTNDGAVFGSGDVITMTIDILARSIHFARNGLPLGWLYRSIPEDITVLFPYVESSCKDGVAKWMHPPRTSMLLARSLMYSCVHYQPQVFTPELVRMLTCHSSHKDHEWECTPTTESIEASSNCMTSGNTHVNLSTVDERNSHIYSKNDEMMNKINSALCVAGADGDEWCFVYRTPPRSDSAASLHNVRLLYLCHGFHLFAMVEDEDDGSVHKVLAAALEPRFATLRSLPTYSLDRIRPHLIRLLRHLTYPYDTHETLCNNNNNKLPQTYLECKENSFTSTSTILVTNSPLSSALPEMQLTHPSYSVKEQPHHNSEQTQKEQEKESKIMQENKTSFTMQSKVSENILSFSSSFTISSLDVFVRALRVLAKAISSYDENDVNANNNKENEYDLIGQSNYYASRNAIIEGNNSNSNQLYLEQSDENYFALGASEFYALQSLIHTLVSLLYIPCNMEPTEITLRDAWNEMNWNAMHCGTVSVISQTPALSFASSSSPSSIKEQSINVEGASSPLVETTTNTTSSSTAIKVENKCVKKETWAVEESDVYGTLHDWLSMCDNNNGDNLLQLFCPECNVPWENCQFHHSPPLTECILLHKILRQHHRASPYTGLLGTWTFSPSHIHHESNKRNKTKTNAKTKANAEKSTNVNYVEKKLGNEETQRPSTLHRNYNDDDDDNDSADSSSSTSTSTTNTSNSITSQDSRNTERTLNTIHSMSNAESQSSHDTNDSDLHSELLESSSSTSSSSLSEEEEEEEETQGEQEHQENEYEDDAEWEDEEEDHVETSVQSNHIHNEAETNDLHNLNISHTPIHTENDNNERSQQNSLIANVNEVGLEIEEEEEEEEENESEESENEYSAADRVQADDHQDEINESKPFFHLSLVQENKTNTKQNNNEFSNTTEMITGSGKMLYGKFTVVGRLMTPISMEGKITFAQSLYGMTVHSSLPAGDWNCPVCTYINLAETTRCAMCSTARPGATWMCAECRYAFNSVDSAVCATCGQPRHRPRYAHIISRLIGGTRAGTGSSSSNSSNYYYSNEEENEFNNNGINGSDDLRNVKYCFCEGCHAMDMYTSLDTLRLRQFCKSCNKCTEWLPKEKYSGTFTATLTDNGDKLTFIAHVHGYTIVEGGLVNRHYSLSLLQRQIHLLNGVDNSTSVQSHFIPPLLQRNYAKLCQSTLIAQGNTITETIESNCNKDNENSLHDKVRDNKDDISHIDTKVTCSANSTLPGALVYYASHIILSCGLQVEPELLTNPAVLCRIRVQEKNWLRSLSYISSTLATEIFNTCLRLLWSHLHGMSFPVIASLLDAVKSISAVAQELLLVHPHLYCQRNYLLYVLSSNALTCAYKKYIFISGNAYSSDDKKLGRSVFDVSDNEETENSSTIIAATVSDANNNNNDVSTMESKHLYNTLNLSRKHNNSLRQTYYGCIINLLEALAFANLSPETTCTERLPHLSDVINAQCVLPLLAVRPAVSNQSLLSVYALMYTNTTSLTPLEYKYSIISNNNNYHGEDICESATMNNKDKELEEEENKHTAHKGNKDNKNKERNELVSESLLYLQNCTSALRAGAMAMSMLIRILHCMDKQQPLPRICNSPLGNSFPYLVSLIDARLSEANKLFSGQVRGSVGLAANGKGKFYYEITLPPEFARGVPQSFTMAEDFESGGYTRIISTSSAPTNTNAQGSNTTTTGINTNNNNSTTVNNIIVISSGGSMTTSTTTMLSGNLNLTNTALQLSTPVIVMGWGTLQHEQTNSNQHVGSDLHSWGFNCVDKVRIISTDQYMQVPHKPKAGDVIGTLLDLDSMMVCWSINGEEMMWLSIPVQGESDKIYPYVSAGVVQHGFEIRLANTQFCPEGYKDFTPTAPLFDYTPCAKQTQEFLNKEKELEEEVKENEEGDNDDAQTAASPLSLLREANKQTLISPQPYNFYRQLCDMFDNIFTTSDRDLFYSNIASSHSRLVMQQLPSYPLVNNVVCTSATFTTTSTAADDEAKGVDADIASTHKEQEKELEEHEEHNALTETIKCSSASSSKVENNSALCHLLPYLTQLNVISELAVVVASQYNCVKPSVFLTSCFTRIRDLLFSDGRWMIFASKEGGRPVHTSMATRAVRIDLNEAENVLLPFSHEPCTMNTSSSSSSSLEESNEQELHESKNESEKEDNINKNRTIINAAPVITMEMLVKSLTRSVTGQLFNQLERASNYKNANLFAVRLAGDVTVDAGGVTRSILSTLANELNFGYCHGHRTEPAVPLFKLCNHSTMFTIVPNMDGFHNRLLESFQEQAYHNKNNNGNNDEQEEVDGNNNNVVDEHEQRGIVNEETNNNNNNINNTFSSSSTTNQAARTSTPSIHNNTHENEEHELRERERIMTRLATSSLSSALREGELSELINHLAMSINSSKNENNNSNGGTEEENLSLPENLYPRMFTWLGMLMGNIVLCGSMKLPLQLPRLAWKYLVYDEITMEDYFYDIDDAIRHSLHDDNFLCDDEFYYSIIGDEMTEEELTHEMIKSQKLSASKQQQPPIVAANRTVNANINNTATHMVRSSSSATFLSQAYPPSQTQTQTQGQTFNPMSGTATPWSHRPFWCMTPAMSRQDLSAMNFAEEYHDYLSNINPTNNNNNNNQGTLSSNAMRTVSFSQDTSEMSVSQPQQLSTASMSRTQTIPELTHLMNNNTTTTNNRREQEQQHALAIRRRKLIEFFLIHQYDPALSALRQGLSKVITPSALKEIRFDDLQVRVCGNACVSADHVLASLDLHAVPMPLREMLHCILDEMSEHQRSQFVLFCSGQSRLPLPEKVHVNVGDDPSQLPTSHTCNPMSLLLQPYPTIDVMREKLLICISHSQKFGFV